jgi:photosystem II stability/assembly factor-like uncharacterized protein
MDMRRQAAGFAVLAVLATGAPPARAVDGGQSGWAWGSPRPQGNDLFALEFAGGGRGYAAGDFGTVLRTDDAGATWTGVPTGRQTAFSELAVLGPDAFVVGGGCTLRRSDDGGRTLKRLPFAASESSCPAPLAALSFASPQAGTLLLADGTVLRTDDGGSTFARRTALPGTRAAGGAGFPRDAVFATPDAGLAVIGISSSGSEIVRTLDGGATWTSVMIAPTTVRSLHLAPGGIAYAVGDGPALYRSADGGGTWERRALADAPGNDAITTIRCRDADTCLMTTARGDRLVRTTDGGATTKVFAPADLPLRAVGWADGNRAVAIGERGTTVVSSDAGVSFTRLGGELPGRYTRIRAASGDLAFAVGLRGALARTTDGGATWTPGAVSTSEDVIDAAFASASTGFALDADGTLLRTDNAGASWRILATGEGGAARSVQALSTNTIVLAGPRGLRRSGNGGDTFDRVGPRTAAVDQLDRAGSALLAYGRRTMLVSSDGGRRWRAVKRPSKRTTIASADFVTARAGFLLDDSGRSFTTRNGGKRWTEMLAAGASPVDGLAFADSRNGWLVLDAFRGDRSGWLLRTDDGGRTFRPQLVSPTPLAARSVGTPTLVATGSRKGIALSLGTESPDDDYSGGSTISGPQSFFATSRGGDAGKEPRLSLAGPGKRPKRGARVRIAGRLVPARGAETVLVSLRATGSTTWRSVSVRVDSDGRFSLTRRIDRGLLAVAQWPGDDTRASAGSRVLAVRVR